MTDMPDATGMTGMTGATPPTPSALLEARRLATVLCDLGAVALFMDRRRSIPVEMFVDGIAVIEGSLMIFALHPNHQRRHRVGELQPGCVVIGSLENIELVPTSQCEIVRIGREVLGKIAADSQTDQALRAGIASTLIACGSSLSPKANRAAACKRCADELSRRGTAVVESSLARHMRRLVNTASASLGFEERLKSMVATKTGPAWRVLPDNRLPPVVRACTQIAVHMGCEAATIPVRIPRDATRKPEQTFAHVAGLGIRPVFLDPGWWRAEIGSLLAFRSEDQAPVAILPTPAGLVAFVHSAGATIGPIQVDEQFAKQLSGTASQFHPTLGAGTVTMAKFLRFTIRGSEMDFVKAFLIAGLAVLVNLTIPLATGLLVVSILPNGNRMGLVFLGLILLGTTVTSAACNFVVASFLLRAETRMDSRALGGILDRCLRMPVEAFRRFTSGDLAERIQSVGDIRSILSGSGISTIMAGIFSVLYLSIMLFVHVQAGIVGAGLLLIAVLVSVGISLGRAKLSTAELEGRGDLATVVLQYIGGIDTIRSASAEQFATVRWLERFKSIRSSAMKLHRIDRIFEVFSATFPLMCLMIFWAMFVNIAEPSSGQELVIDGVGSIAAYLVFNSAFVSALFSVLDFGARLGDLASLRSTLRRIAPILVSPTETAVDREVPGVLTGQIQIEDVRFAYPGSANEILSGVSLRIEAGESVAIVGPSGSGKSTLLQLILGLRFPSTGVVMFDGKALERLDLVSVRRQIGAVIQNTRIIPGTILDNIVGSTLFNKDDAQRAINEAGFGDEVDRMPMGMSTYVTDQTLSGGQLQKLMIARALVTRPKILVFDEATSALDEISQAQVVRSLEGLKATRIVVAHRLSTVRMADRIYVMEAGRVVQSGNFAQLISVEGAFKQLAERQMIDSIEPTES